MIPNRGLQWSSQTIGLGRRRIGTLPARQFSSSSVQHRQFRASPLISNTTSSFSKAYPRTSLFNTNQILRNGASIRFASTTPVASTIASASTPASTTPSVPDVVPSPQDLTTSLDSFSELDFQTISQIPEHIGYLKSLGLDYGWGPTAVVEWALEHTHVLCGTPWWLSITLTAVAVRLLMFKPYILAAENASKVAAVKPFMAPLTEKMNAARVAGDMDTMMECRRELQLMNRRAGIKLWKSFAPIIQMFTGYGTFVLLRAMAKLPVPGFEDGGVLWFYNLSIPDPYFVLPVATAGILHWMLRRGGETGQTTVSPEAQKAMSYGLPVLTLLFTWWLPAAVQISFFVSGVFSYIQASIFQHATFRRWLGLPPIVPGKAAPISPYKGTMKIAASTPASTPTSGAARPSPALSTSELNSRFQASNPTSAGAEPPITRTRSFLQKMTKPMGEVAESGRAMIDKANTKMDQRRARGEMEERKRYETKRQEELKQERYELESRRRAERAAKKAARQNDSL